MEVILKQKQAFREILRTYKPSPKAKDVLAQMDLVILLGISGAGRNTIINQLTQGGKYHFVVSDTTRPPKIRDGNLEQNGVNYFFRKESELLEDLRNGMFLEAELIHDQQVSGTSIRELEKAAKSGKIPINEVDFLGTVNIREAKPDTKFFFVIAPSYDEWIRRITTREEISKKELQNRINTAVTILEEALATDIFHFVVNTDFHESAAYIDQVVDGKIDQSRDAEARAVAEDILRTLREHDHVLA